MTAGSNKNILSEQEYRNVMITFLIFLISPLVSLPLLFRNIYRRQPCALLMLSLFLGLFAYVSMPVQDVGRNMEHYEDLALKSFSMITPLDIEANGLIVFVYWAMGHIGIPFDFMRLFQLSTGFYMMSLIFVYHINNSVFKYTNYEYMVRFLIMFLFFDGLYVISSARYGYALCLYIYGIHQLFDRHSKAKSILFFSFASLIHPSWALFTVGSLLIYSLRLKIRTSIVIGFVLLILMAIVFQKFSYLFGMRADWYLSGRKGGVTDYSHMTLPGFLGYSLPKICGLCFAVFLLTKYTMQNKWMRLSLVWFTLSCVCISNPVFLFRVWWPFSCMGLFMFLSYERLRKHHGNAAKRLLVCAVLFFVFDLVPQKVFLVNSEYYRILFPVPVILSHHYTLNEVVKKVPDALSLDN